MRFTASKISVFLWILVIAGCASTVNIHPETTSAVREAPARVADGFFDSNGVQIRFTDTGDGEPVVLIHGYTGSLDWNWVEPGTARALVDEGYRVIAMDCRGHGQSDKPHEVDAYGIEMVEDVVRLLDYLVIDTAHVVGYSMGGVIANKLRAMHPERLESAILGGAGWWQERQEGFGLIKLGDTSADLRAGRGIETLQRALTPAGQPPLSEEAIREVTERLTTTNDILALAAVADGLVEMDVAESDLRENRIPTLALIGEIDPIKGSVDALEGVMANLEVKVIPGADHMAAFSAPQFIEGLLGFLAEQRANTN